MDLRPFDPADAVTVASWATSPAEVNAWCSRGEATVPAAVVAGWSEADDVAAFALTDEAQVIGYGELWIDDDEGECELARIIVAPASRGHGVGLHLVRLLVGRAKAIHPATYLRVLPDNHAARRCYATAGFVRVPAHLEAEWNQAQPAAYVWMTHPG